MFNYEFDSLTHDDPVIVAVYTALREAEYRSTYPIAYWNIPPLRYLVPRQRQCMEALKVCCGLIPFALFVSGRIMSNVCLGDFVAWQIQCIIHCRRRWMCECVGYWVCHCVCYIWRLGLLPLRYLVPRQRQCKEALKVCLHLYADLHSIDRFGST